MEELNEFKIFLNGGESNGHNYHEFSHHEIKRLIEEKRFKHITNVRSKLLLDFVVGIAVLIVTTYLLVSRLPLTEALIMLSLVVLPILLLYIYLHKRTRNIDISGKEIKQALEALKSNILKVKRIYMKAASIGFPILYFGNYILMGIVKSNLLEFTKTDAIVIAIGSICTILIPWVMKKIIRLITEDTIQEINDDLQLLKEKN